MNTCYYCGTTTNEGYSWYRNYDLDNNSLCGLCYRRLILNYKWNPINHKKYNPIYSKRKQRYKDKFIICEDNPRQGICCWCWETKKRTEMAHLKGYYNDDPTYGTYELCVKCHRKFDKGKLKPSKTRAELELLMSKTVRLQYYRLRRYTGTLHGLR